MCVLWDKKKCLFFRVGIQFFGPIYILVKPWYYIMIDIGTHFPMSSPVMHNVITTTYARACMAFHSQQTMHNIVSQLLPVLIAATDSCQWSTFNQPRYAGITLSRLLLKYLSASIYYNGCDNILYIM
jgi:hypothetical protein